jgi:hypothetical protein
MDSTLAPSIQELLAALPEMFPGVQKIPLANIRLNPDNPGPRPAEEEIGELAANIALEGLKNPVKVMPDPEEPLAPSVTPHPDNPRLKADGTPWALSDFRFLNLSGELRQLACQRLQWTEINGYVLNPTPEEAVVIVRLDNQVRDKGWWADYQSIEQLIKANPNLKQREIGTRLRIKLESVNWALRLLPLLNTEARGVLVRNPNKPNKENKGISESAAFRLTALGPGTGLKRGGSPNDPPQALYPYPAIPPETQDLVYRTLVTAIDHQMTEAQVGKLVERVQAGMPADSFRESAHAPRPETSAQVPQSFEDTTPKIKTLSHSSLPPEMADKVVELPVPSVPRPHAEAKPSGADSHMESAQPKHGAQPEASHQVFWQWMLGISFIKQLRSKVKKGESLTLNEKMLVGAYKIYKVALEPAGKHIGRFAKWMFKGIWDSSKKALGKIFGKTVEVLLPWLIVIGLVWGILAFFHFVVVSPWHWVEHKVISIFHHEDITPAQTPIPTPQPVASTILPKVEAVVAHLAPEKKAEKTNFCSGCNLPTRRFFRASRFPLANPLRPENSRFRNSIPAAKLRGERLSHDAGRGHAGRCGGEPYAGFDRPG